MHEKSIRGNYKSSTGLLVTRGCPLRLREISVQRNRGPTTLTGGQVSNGNAIRRRVARIGRNKYRNEKAKESYGPLFGLKRSPHLGGDGSNCNDKALYSANSGSSSDVIFWRGLYGGSRLLFDTNSCSYGCCDSTLFKKDANCVCFEINVTVNENSDYTPKKGDSLIPEDELVAGGDPNDNLITNVKVVAGGVNSLKKYKLKLRTRKGGRVFRKLLSLTAPTSMVVTAQDLLRRDRYIPVGIVVVQPKDNNGSKYTAVAC